MAQYLFVIVTIYPFEGVLDRNGSHIEKYLKCCITNPNSEARANGRKAFLVWQRIASEGAQILFGQLDYAAQKAIIEEQDKFGGFDESYVEE